MADKEVRIFIKIDGIEQEVKSVQELESAMSDLSKETKDAKEEGLGMRAVEEIFSRLPAPIQQAAAATRGFITSLKGVKAAVAATGIGALVIALTSLLGYIKTTAAGFDGFNKALATAGALVDQLTIAFGRLFKLDVAGAFRAITTELSGAIRASQNLVDLQESLRKSTNLAVVEIAELNKEFETQQKIAEDTNRTFQERADAAVNAATAQARLAAINADLARQEESLLAISLQYTSNVEERRELENQLAEAQAKRIDAETELEIKRLDIGKVAIEIEKERQEVLLGIGEQLIEQQLELQDIALNRTLVELNVAEEQALKQAELAGASELALTQIKETYAARRVQIEENAQQEIQAILAQASLELIKSELQVARETARINKEARDEELRQRFASNEDYLESERIFQAELAQIEFDAQRQIKDKINQLVIEGIDDQLKRATIELNFQEDQAIKELELLEATEEQKLKVRELYENKRLALVKQKAEVDKQIQKEQLEAGLDVASQVFGAIGNLVGENTRLGKAAAIASATIDTYAAANKAIAAYPPPFGFIAAAVAVAAGIANVAKIASTPIPGGDRGATGIAADPNVPTASSVDPLAALQDLQNQQAIDQDFGIQQTGTQATPLRAYVVSEDINRAQEADRKIRNLARL